MSGETQGHSIKRVAMGMLKAAIRERNEEAVKGYLASLRKQGFPAEEMYQQALEELGLRERPEKTS